VLTGEAEGVVAGQAAGKSTGWSRHAMAAPYWVTPGGAAPDQITDEQVLVSQSPPKVNEGPVSTIGQGQIASAGLSGSISHDTSRQFAHLAASGQVIAWNWLVTFWVENVDTNFVPEGVRSLQVV
jgi:hypothetical protein